MPTDEDRLLDAASRVLTLDPSAGMGAVARGAGISRATLHRRYPTRACLESAIVDRATTRLQAITDQIDASGLTGRAAIEALVPLAFPVGESMAFLLTSPAALADPDLQAKGEIFASRWAVWIEEGQRRGDIRVDLPARWVIEALHGLGHAALYAASAGLVATRDAQRLMLSTLLDGVGAPAPLSAPRP